MIALVDFGAGNLGSVANALDRLNAPFAIVSTAEPLARARTIIFPGVGAAAPAMAALAERGMDLPIRQAIARGVPFLGICLGLQLLFESSAEDGATCLGVLRGTVDRLATPEKLPHVGWNAVQSMRAHLVLDGLEDEPMYFVHSYVVAPSDATVVVATTDYGVAFPSVVASNRLIGVQFHPERSGAAGLRLLQNFVSFARTSVAAA
jgi:glutamine amidotransferase